MIQAILFTILSFLIIASGAFLVFLLIRKKKNKYTIASSIALGISVLLCILVPGSFHQVEAGQVAVIKNLGRVVGTRSPGTYFDFYLTNSYTYFDTTVQRLDINTASYSSDAQTMEIQMTVQFRIDPTKAENILTEYQTMESLSARIEKVADDNTKSILSKYTAMKIIETRAAISPEVEQSIKLAVGDRYYATVTAVNLTNIDFTPEFEKSVEDKVIAEQQKEAAITKAEQELEVAKLEAQAQIEAAHGDAESQKIIAQATAEAMALKLVEFSRSIGFTIDETYLYTEETEIKNYQTSEIISSQILEKESKEKLSTGSILKTEEEKNIITKITTTLLGTEYSIQYDETHTKDDLKIAMEFIKYLEYLEKWDGKLPEVVAGDKSLDLLIPATE